MSSTFDSIDIVLWVQTHHFMDDFWVALTLIGDPANLLLYIVPCVLWGVHRRTAYEAFVALVSADFINASLKWPLAGDRPYWYSTKVREFWMTCESGYGNPSGHAMVSCAVLASLVWNRPQPYKLSVAALLILIAVSRVHVGAHFPEQVILGLMCGFFVAWKSRSFVDYASKKLANSTLFHHCLLSFAVSGGMVAFTMAEYSLLSLFRDPLASVSLARAGCDLGEKGLHLTTSPFQGVFRDAGVALGAGLSLSLLHSIRGPLKAWVSTPEGWTLSNNGAVFTMATVRRLLRLAIGCGAVFGSHRVGKRLTSQLANAKGPWQACAIAFTEFFFIAMLIMLVLPKLFHAMQLYGSNETTGVVNNESNRRKSTHAMSTRSSQRH